MNLQQLFETHDVMYHATFKPYLSSIFKHGLKPDMPHKSWRYSHDVVCLSPTPEVAESYAENADEVPDDFINEVVILQVDMNQLNPKLLFRDRNVRDESDSAYEYRGVIPPQAIKVFTRGVTEGNNIERLDDGPKRPKLPKKIWKKRFPNEKQWRDDRPVKLNAKPAVTDPECVN